MIFPIGEGFRVGETRWGVYKRHETVSITPAHWIEVWGQEVSPDDQPAAWPTRDWPEFRVGQVIGEKDDDKEEMFVISRITCIGERTHETGMTGRTIHITVVDLLEFERQNTETEQQRTYRELGLRWLERELAQPFRGAAGPP